LDTVGSETPASAAMAASVVFRTTSPFGMYSKCFDSGDRLHRSSEPHCSRSIVRETTSQENR
jgi:hypothetical protein